MKVYKKITDDRFTERDIADAMGAETRAVVTLIKYGHWRKAVYLVGRRVWSN